MIRFQYQYNPANYTKTINANNCDDDKAPASIILSPGC